MCASELVVVEAAAARRLSSRMLSLRLRLLLAFASGILCALPIHLHLCGLLSPLAAPPASLLLDHPNPLAAAVSFHGDLRLLSSSWNHLPFPSRSSPPPLLLHIALFVKTWPFTTSPGGLERHALTLHRQLADRGHQIHVFTTDGTTADLRDWEEDGLHFHVYPPNERGRFDIMPAWETFLMLNASRPFDIVHSESVALPAAQAKVVGRIGVVSWHGIAYEIIHSDIVGELNRLQEEKPREDAKLKKALSERVRQVVEEVRWFPSYAHHVATSDHVGDVLQTIYQIPPRRVHTILNGVDQRRFRPDAAAAQRFRVKRGLPLEALILGAAGRLVKDKGYPLLFHAFSQLLAEHPSVFLLIAGDGPWASRFNALPSTNVLVLGPLAADELALFYNAIDIFVNPTMRAQGLDHTLLESMLCGKPILATHFPSITRSAIVHDGLGYTFAPNVPSLLASMRTVTQDGRQVLRHKGKRCYERASVLFTATKMAAAYERLFMCITHSSYCMY